MSDVVKEVNEVKTGGKKIDTMAIDAAEKAAILAGEKDFPNPANARRLAGTDSKDVMIGSESTAGPQDAVVPPKSTDVVTGGIGPSKAVPQQIDSSGPKDSIEDKGTGSPIQGTKEKDKGIPTSSEVEQQEDKGIKGI